LIGWGATRFPNVLLATTIVHASDRFASLVVANKYKLGSNAVVRKKDPGAVALSVSDIIVVKLRFLRPYAPNDSVVVLLITVIASNIDKRWLAYCDPNLLEDVAGGIINVVSAKLYNSVSYTSTESAAVAYLWLGARGASRS
jgi:hypothetical protein